MTKPDSDREGTQESANSEGSSSESNQKGVQAAQYVTKEDFDRFQESLRRTLQSDKDKGIKRVEQRVDAIDGDLKKILLTASQRNMSVGDLLGEIEQQEQEQDRLALRELTQAFRSGKFPQGGSDGTEQQRGVDVGAVLKEMEWDESDTRVQEFRSRQFSSETEMWRQAAALNRKILTTRPDDTETQSRESQRQLTQPQQQQLKEEYDRRAEKLSGPALVRLKKEMRGKGLRGI